MDDHKISVVIADDHPIVILGVHAILKDLPRVDVVASVENSTALFKELKARKVDIVVTDYAMPGGAHGDGIEMLTRLRNGFPDLKVIVLTVLTNTAMLNNIVKLGVDGLLNKSSEIREIPLAVDRVSKGLKYYGKSVSDVLSAQMMTPEVDKIRDLSKKELEVLRMYFAGMAVKDIAEAVRRSAKTVSNQKRSAMNKLGCDNDAELFQYYALFGDTPPDR